MVGKTVFGGVCIDVRERDQITMDQVLVTSLLFFFFFSAGAVWCVPTRRLHFFYSTVPLLYQLGTCSHIAIISLGKKRVVEATG
jgi:hypothetical protein